MAKRQRWKEELKTKFSTDEQPPKMHKIEILKEVVYKDGLKIRSVTHSKKNTLPEHSSLPTTPHQTKVAKVSVKDLTPTFRKPKSYMSETKRITDKFLVQLKSCTFLNNSSQIDTALREEINSNDDGLNSSDFETISNINVSGLIQNTSYPTYNCLMTIDSDERLVSPKSFTENSRNEFDITPDSLDGILCKENVEPNIPEMKDCWLVTDQKSLSCIEEQTKNNDCSTFSDQKLLSTAEIIPEITKCLPFIDQRSETNLSAESRKISDTPENPPKNNDCLAVTGQISSNTALKSPKNEDCLPPTGQNISSIIENISENENYSPATHQESLSTAVFVPEIKNCLPVTNQKYSAAYSKASPVSTNAITEAKTNNKPQENVSSEDIKTRVLSRKCKKKLNFDTMKSYLDFFEDDDADTLLLNEAFPSEESSCSVSDNESSDDSESSKTKKKRNKSKRGKKLNEKINKKGSNKDQAQLEEHVLITKPQSKKSINKENKIKKALGQFHYNEKGDEVPSKCMKPNPCNGVACKRNCGDISDTRRQQLFTFYWNLGSIQRQRDWISKSAIKKKKSTYTTDKGESSRRNTTYEYYINEGDGRRQVCQNFLMKTLDISQRFLLYTLDNTIEGFAKQDARGNNGGGNRTAENVKDHAKLFMKSLPLVPSHYCRKDSNKLYLPDNFKNTSNLYRIYENNCKEEGVNSMSFKVFSNWLKENYNIGFHIPKKDKCMVCMAQTYDVKNLDEMSKYDNHIQEKEESYKRFQCHQKLNAMDPSVVCASFDMQKVLNTPHGENMALYYSRKIAVYNLTIYESNTKVGYSNLWTEVDARRGANEISTCLYNYLQEVDKRGNVKTLLLYSDSCYGQNKNKTMLSMLRYFLSKAVNLEVIQINYLIPGHTFMPVDSMHATIEGAIRKTTVWAPSQWPTVVEYARKKPTPYRVSTLGGTDFMSFNEIMANTFKKSQKFEISKLRIATFKKADPDHMFIKNSMVSGAETIMIPLCSINGTNIDPKPNLYSKLPISLKKYNDLKKLVDKGIIPKCYSQEYLKLKHDKKVKDTLEIDEEEQD